MVFKNHNITKHIVLNVLLYADDVVMTQKNENDSLYDLDCSSRIYQKCDFNVREGKFNVTAFQVKPPIR